MPQCTYEQCDAEAVLVYEVLVENKIGAVCFQHLVSVAGKEWVKGRGVIMVMPLSCHGVYAEMLKRQLTRVNPDEEYPELLRKQ